MLKVVAKKLTATQQKQSKVWEGYRKYKVKIEGSNLSRFAKKMALEEKIGEIRQKEKGLWVGYREKVVEYTHKSPWEGIAYQKKLTGGKRIDKVTGKEKEFKFDNGYQEVYRVKGGNLESKIDKIEQVIPEMLEKDNVKGVLIVFTIHNEDTGLDFIVSNWITKDLMDGGDFDSLEEYVFDVLDRHVTGFGDYCFVKSFQLRVVYEKS
jgi:hypothetical protein